RPSLRGAHEPERVERRRARPDVLAPDRLLRVLGDPLRLGDLAGAEEHLGELALRLDEEPAILRRPEPPHRVAQQLLRTLHVAALKLERAEDGGRPARAPRGADL